MTALLQTSAAAWEALRAPPQSICRSGISHGHWPTTPRRTREDASLADVRTCRIIRKGQASANKDLIRANTEPNF